MVTETANLSISAEAVQAMNALVDELLFQFVYSALKSDASATAITIQQLTAIIAAILPADLSSPAIAQGDILLAEEKDKNSKQSRHWQDVIFNDLKDPVATYKPDSESVREYLLPYYRIYEKLNYHSDHIIATSRQEAPETQQSDADPTAFRKVSLFDAEVVVFTTGTLENLVNHYFHIILQYTINSKKTTIKMEEVLNALSEDPVFGERFQKTEVKSQLERKVTKKLRRDSRASTSDSIAGGDNNSMQRNGSGTLRGRTPTISNSPVQTTPKSSLSAVQAAAPAYAEPPKSPSDDGEATKIRRESNFGFAKESPEVSKKEMKGTTEAIKELEAELKPIEVVTSAAKSESEPSAKRISLVQATDMNSTFSDSAQMLDKMEDLMKNLSTNKKTQENDATNNVVENNQGTANKFDNILSDLQSATAGTPQSSEQAASTKPSNEKGKKPDSLISSMFLKNGRLRETNAIHSLDSLETEAEENRFVELIEFLKTSPEMLNRAHSASELDDLLDGSDEPDQRAQELMTMVEFLRTTLPRNSKKEAKAGEDSSKAVDAIRSPQPVKLQARPESTSELDKKFRDALIDFLKKGPEEPAKKRKATKRKNSVSQKQTIQQKTVDFARKILKGRDGNGTPKKNSQNKLDTLDKSLNEANQENQQSKLAEDPDGPILPAEELLPSSQQSRPVVIPQARDAGFSSALKKKTANEGDDNSLEVEFLGVKPKSKGESFIDFLNNTSPTSEQVQVSKVQSMRVQRVKDDSKRSSLMIEKGVVPAEQTPVPDSISTAKSTDATAAPKIEKPKPEIKFVLPSDKSKSAEPEEAPASAAAPSVKFLVNKIDSTAKETEKKPLYRSKSMAASKAIASKLFGKKESDEEKEDKPKKVGILSRLSRVGKSQELASDDKNAEKQAEKAKEEPQAQSATQSSQAEKKQPTQEEPQEQEKQAPPKPKKPAYLRLTILRKNPKNVAKTAKENSPESVSASDNAGDVAVSSQSTLVNPQRASIIVEDSKTTNSSEKTLTAKSESNSNSVEHNKVVDLKKTFDEFRRSREQVADDASKLNAPEPEKMLRSPSLPGPPKLPPPTSIQSKTSSAQNALSELAENPKKSDDSSSSKIQLSVQESKESFAIKQKEDLPPLPSEAVDTTKNQSQTDVSSNGGTRPQSSAQPSSGFIDESTANVNDVAILKEKLLRMQELNAQLTAQLKSSQQQQQSSNRDSIVANQRLSTYINTVVTGAAISNGSAAQNPQNVTQTIQILNSQNAVLKNQNQMLQNQLLEMKSKNISLTSQVKQSSTAHDTLKSQFDSYRETTGSKIQSLTEENQQLKSEVEFLKQQMDLFLQGVSLPDGSLNTAAGSPIVMDDQTKQQGLVQNEIILHDVIQSISSDNMGQSTQMDKSHGRSSLSQVPWNGN